MCRNVNNRPSCFYAQPEPGSSCGSIKPFVNSKCEKEKKLGNKACKSVGFSEND